MVRYRVIVVLLEGGDSRYELMAHILERSVVRNAPGAEFEIHRLCRERDHYENPYLLDNTLKLRQWAEVAETTQVPVVFLDADMVCLRPLDPAFEEPYDVLLTRRDDGLYNAGVVFAKPTETARRFFADWWAWNWHLYKNPDELKKAQEKHDGMNQAALPLLLPRDGVGSLPTRLWNCMDRDWSNFDEDTRLLHIKGSLRRTCFGERKPTKELAYPYFVWRQHADLHPV